MQSISTIVVAFGLLASQVTATIALGNNANNICKLTASIDSPRRTCWESAVMWIYSDNSCSGVVIPSSPVNVSNGFNCKYCLSTDNSNRRRTSGVAEPTHDELTTMMDHSPINALALALLPTRIAAFSSRESAKREPTV
ncbi:hypothetical protein CC77DRAFT_1006366 [Alternaria alternata]|uniref:Uncharacterized protein n=1 Tax=Alternaria alternata TaxID=5599 RepID=A0A177DVV7_ALTAL|nr:hypothetical protein CC77DRAFT_1006366 [Alternaria alternata]OAG22929.1 hypothetical protein CC77DRAFT_1006366 [Alternaria alternata]